MNTRQDLRIGLSKVRCHLLLQINQNIEGNIIHTKIPV